MRSPVNGAANNLPYLEHKTNGRDWLMASRSIPRRRLCAALKQPGRVAIRLGFRRAAEPDKPRPSGRTERAGQKEQGKELSRELGSYCDRYYAHCNGRC